jgi:pimeloyl-ACP methyl ester carboxylesterase
LNETITQTIFDAVRGKIENLYHRYLDGKQSRLYIVAHSFGTLAVTNALMLGDPGATVEALVLLGSIVPRAFPWDPLVERGQLRRAPLAIVRPLDGVVLGARLVGGGTSGTFGFIANGVHLPTETYKNGGHTAYDPDDAADIATVVRDGIDQVDAMSYPKWWEQCGTMTRLRVKFGRLFKR